MRSIAILAATLAILPLAAQAQTSTTQSTQPTTSTTVKADMDTMWAKIKGSWTQTKGAVKEQWGKLTDNDLMEIEGRREKLVGKIQTRYAISHEQADAQVSGWEKKHKDM